MNLDNITNFNSSDTLIRLVKEIKAPLESIIEANKKLTNTDKHKGEDITDNIIFNSSQEIASLIDEVVRLANGGKTVEKTPLIYQIYFGNESSVYVLKKD